MYELLVLGVLMRRPQHGYAIARLIDDVIGPVARLSHGRLYPLLAKMARDESIVAMGSGGDRGRRSFQITESGRQRFYRLMMDTTSKPGAYQKVFWYKALFLDELQPAERVHVVNHYLTYCQAHLTHLRGDAAPRPRVARRRGAWQAELEARHQVAQHLSRRWQLDLEQARALLPHPHEG